MFLFEGWSGPTHHTSRAAKPLTPERVPHQHPLTIAPGWVGWQAVAPCGGLAPQTPHGAWWLTSLCGWSQDVRVDTKLNKFLLSQGIKAVPGRVRVRKRNDDEEVRSRHPAIEMALASAYFPLLGFGHSAPTSCG